MGKDQPPDLAAFVPSDATILPDNLEKTPSSVAPEKNHISADIKSKVVTGTILASITILYLWLKH